MSSDTPAETSPAERSGILIVDDQPAGLAVISKLLSESGFRVRTVTSGERALEAARASPPDLVLLDVAMPGMDGFATCAAFRSDPRLSSIPVIFLTAFDDAEHKTRAFSAGGRDYISKPFQAAEVLARVGSQLRIASMERQLKTQNSALADANAKLREVAELKARVAAMLIHDVRSPLMMIGLVLDGEPDPQSMADARNAFRKVTRLLDDALELYRTENVPPAADLVPIDVASVLATSVAAARYTADTRGVDLRMGAVHSPVMVRGDAVRLDRAFSNLLDNALKFTPRGGRVSVSIDLEVGTGVESGLQFIAVSITDTGPGIPALELPYVFDPYRQTSTSRGKGGFGLGLASVQRIAAEHGGRVLVRSNVGVGTEFRILLVPD